MGQKIIVIGERVQSGVYFLRIQLNSDIQLAFGKYQNGRPIGIRAGEIIYLGSAMGQKGSACLAHRLLRHATRSISNSAHPIRDDLLRSFLQAGLGPPSLTPPKKKKLFWNIDYLLEREEININGVAILRTRRRCEPILGRVLANRKETKEIAPGLGAQDLPGNTHILQVVNQGFWERWLDLLYGGDLDELDIRTILSDGRA